MDEITPVNPLASEAFGWYNKAIDKVAKRYYSAMGTKREQGYVDVYTRLIELHSQIDVVYREYLAGERDIEEFKDSIRVWFKEIMSGWTDIDLQSRGRVLRKKKIDKIRKKESQASFSMTLS